MPLNTPQLNASILQAIQDSKEATGYKPVAPNTKLIPTASEIALARGIANAIDAYIRQATVTVSPGIVVTTPTGPGATVSPGSATIS